MILSGPRDDSVNGRLRTCFVIASTPGLAVDRNYLVSCDLVQRSNPVEQTLFKRRWWQRTENSVEPIMRRNTLRQIQRCTKPILLRADEFRDGNEVIRTSDHCGQGHDDRVDQEVIGLSGAWMREVCKMVPNRCNGNPGH